MTELKNTLTGALIGLARASEGNEQLLNERTLNLLIDALSASAQDSQTTSEDLTELIYLVKKEKFRLSPDCSECKTACGRTADFDMNELRLFSPVTAALKKELLASAVLLAQKAKQNEIREDAGLTEVFLSALFMVGSSAFSDSSIAEATADIKRYFI